MVYGLESVVPTCKTGLFFPTRRDRIRKSSFLYLVELYQNRLSLIFFLPLRPQNLLKMSELAPCPVCKSTYTYQMDSLLVCPECGHEWNPEEAVENTDAFVVKDCNGNILQDGDTVVTIKNLPVRGSSQSIKAGTKVKNIRLVDSDHNIDCKIDGFGAMALKSEFVKKA